MIHGKRNDGFIARPAKFNRRRYYTKWGDLKLTMIGEAAADARRRAETLAQTSGAKVGALRYIRQGVFQIVPAYSTAVSDYGMNDTSSEEKTIKATVSVRYALN
jgi:hypothetical protein